MTDTVIQPPTIKTREELEAKYGACQAFSNGLHDKCEKELMALFVELEDVALSAGRGEDVYNAAISHIQAVCCELGMRQVRAAGHGPPM